MSGQTQDGPRARNPQDHAQDDDGDYRPAQEKLEKLRLDHPVGHHRSHECHRVGHQQEHDRQRRVDQGQYPVEDDGRGQRPARDEQEREHGQRRGQVLRQQVGEPAAAGFDERALPGTQQKPDAQDDRSEEVCDENREQRAGHEVRCRVVNQIGDQQVGKDDQQQKGSGEQVKAANRPAAAAT